MEASPDPASLSSRGASSCEEVLLPSNLLLGACTTTAFSMTSIVSMVCIDMCSLGALRSPIKLVARWSRLGCTFPFLRDLLNTSFNFGRCFTTGSCVGWSVCAGA